MKTSSAINTMSITDFSIWELAKQNRALLSVTMDLTARCNNDCIHCYINLPAWDKNAVKEELTLDGIKKITDQAVSMGALWILLSGGEPLLRPDFFDIYTYLKKQGLLVSIFTNASLITSEHIRLFKKFPPRDIEITIYGTTKEVHKKVTRKDTFQATMKGIEQLLSADLQVTLKSTIMRANADQFDEISRFCRSKSDRPFRFDSFLQLRTDKNPKKNKCIISQRLSPEEIIRIEQKNPVRFQSLKQKCREIASAPLNTNSKLFKCQAGINSCAVNYRGIFQLCSSLSCRHCSLDLKDTTLAHAWEKFTPAILNKTSISAQYQKHCGTCNKHDICSWCPAHADLETNELDGYVQYYCDIAQARNIK